MRLFLLEEKNWSVLSASTKTDENLIIDYICNCNDSAAAGLFAMFRRFAELGHAGFNSSQLHEVDKSESIYQLSKGRHRILFFNMNGRAILLSCPHIKKGAKVDSSEVKKAIKMKKEYEHALQRNTVEVVRG